MTQQHACDFIVNSTDHQWCGKPAQPYLICASQGLRHRCEDHAIETRECGEKVMFRTEDGLGGSYCVACGFRVGAFRGGTFRSST